MNQFSCGVGIKANIHWDRGFSINPNKEVLFFKIPNPDIMKVCLGVNWIKFPRYDATYLIDHLLHLRLIHMGMII